MRLLNGMPNSAALVAVCILFAVGQRAPAAAADGSVAVGVVADFRPLNRPPVLSRLPHGELVDVRIGTLVIAGDQVALDNGDQSVTVQLASGDVARFVGPGAFRVPNGRSLGKLAAIFQSLPELFNDAHGLSGTAASRSVEECGMPGFEPLPISTPAIQPETRVVAGHRELLIAWNGGCPPFSVTLRSGTAVLQARDSVNEWYVQLNELELNEGRYLVHISDSSGKHWEGPLYAQSQPAPIPEEIAADNSSLGRNAQAICLAGQGEGRWRLESVNWLQSLRRAGDPLATAIGDRLMWGTYLPRPEVSK